MPSIIAKHADPTGDFYLTPPVPDPVRPGHHVLKIGMPQDDHVRVSAADLSAWYRTDGDPAVAARLDGMVRGLLPGLRWTGRWTGSCVTTYTPTGHPAIDWVGPGVHAGAERIACCVGGNGYAAKCAPSLGGLAAGMLLGDPWPTEVDRDQFRARFRV
jgi:sarcosine oxidase